MYSKCYHVVNRRIMPFLFCLPFANRASVSGGLYIDFDRNHLIFLAAYLVCQVDALFIIFLSEHAYALHIPSRISCHVLHHVACAFSRCWLWFRLFVFLSWVEPGDEFVNEEPVEYAYEDQAFDNSENLAGKMTTPRNHFYLCYASFALLPCSATYHLLYHVSYFSHVSP